MKLKSYFVLFLAILSTSLAQGQRLVLIEQGTNVNSNAAANQNPDFEALLEANSDKVIFVRYHWFFPGTDPLNQDNPEEADDRFNDFYGLSIVPNATVDGALPNEDTPGFDESNVGWPAGAPGGFSQTLIDTAFDETPSFDIDIDYNLSPQDISVDVTATCTEAASGNLKLRVIIIEEEIIFSESPGSNGETLFKNVMKKFLPSTEGAPMANSYAVGETFNFQDSWELSNVYDPSELAVIAFVQDDDTKEILQAGFSNGGSFEPIDNFDAQTLSISTLDALSCESTINPSVEIRNNGAEVLTSVDLNYSINGSEGIVPWTGALNFFETATVDLGSISFNQDVTNILEVFVSNPNGEMDENPLNDTTSAAAPVAPLATLDIILIVRTDFFPSETSWEIRNSDNDLIASDQYSGNPNGGGIDATAEFDYEISLEEYDCYSMTIFDEEGDGLSFTGGNPNSIPFGFRILNSDSTLVTEYLGSELDFGFDYTELFETQEFFGINESALNQSLKIYPNPSGGMVNITFNLEETQETWIEVYSLAGQVQKRVYVGVLGPGESLQNIDLRDLSNGLYLLSIQTADSRAVRKVSLIK